MGRRRFTVTFEHDELLALIDVLQIAGPNECEECGSIVDLVAPFPEFRALSKLTDVRDGRHGAR